MEYGTRRLILIAVGTLALLIGAVAIYRHFDNQANQPREIVISCGAVGVELELCQSGVAAWSKESGFPARVVTASSNSGERLGSYQLLLASHSSDIDVFVIDTPWPGVIGDFFLDLTDVLEPDVRADQFAGFIDNNTVRGRLVALPWFIDGGLLYYRKDLLESYGFRVPQSWQELTETAKQIQNSERRKGRTDMWGFVFAARAYEGLTCAALEWIHSSGGGSIVDPKGQVSVNNEAAREVLSLAASWIGSIAPRGVLGYMEEETRAVFQSGRAVFMRNWPYAWELSQAAESPVRGKVGITVLPKGNGENAKATSALGGWSLAVSKFSKNPEASKSLAKYLASASEQKRRALRGGLSPTWRSLYNDPELLAKNPALKDLKPVYDSALPRPSKIVASDYNRVSSEFYEAVHGILSGGKPEPLLEQLESDLTLLKRKGRWQ
jgi:trehalose/maltose transport system substrate-binding protein